MAAGNVAGSGKCPERSASRVALCLMDLPRWPMNEENAAASHSIVLRLGLRQWNFLRGLMPLLRTLFRHLLKDESGQDLIEYALVAALVALAAIASIRSLGTAVDHAFASLGTSLTGDV